MTKFQVGDKVSWCGKEGKVVSVDYNAEQSVVVEFGDLQKAFTDDGRSKDIYLVPSLIKLEPKEAK